MSLTLKEQIIYTGLSTALAVSSIACEIGKRDNKGVKESTPVVAVIPENEEKGDIQIEILTPLPIVGEQVKRVAVGDTLRSLEGQLGKSKLTFSQAEEIAQLTTRLYHESTNSPIIEGDIYKQVFILEGTEGVRFTKRAEEMTRAELEQVPFIMKLMSNYPHSSFPDSILRTAVSSGATVNGFVDKGYVFVNLDEANGNSVTTPTYPHYPKDQYFGIGLEVDCSPLGPASSFRGTLLHEYSHRDGEQEIYPIDPDFFPIFQSVRGWISPVEPKEQLGLGIRGQIQGTSSMILVPLFEEIGSHYIAARISEVNGLGYGINDHTDPRILYNLGQIFAQARIDDMTYLDLHRRGQLKDLMFRVAKAGKGEVNRPLTLAFNLANAGIIRIDTRLDLNSTKTVRDYYPTVTASKYKCR